jgi:hypothetical protein
LTFPNSYWVQTVELCGPNCTSRVQWMCGLWPTFLRMCGLCQPASYTRLCETWVPSNLVQFSSEFSSKSPIFGEFFPILKRPISSEFSDLPSRNLSNFRFSELSLVVTQPRRFSGFPRGELLKLLNVFGHTFVARDSHTMSNLSPLIRSCKFRRFWISDFHVVF